MFSIKIRRPWDMAESLHTPESVYHKRQQHRREFLERWDVRLSGQG